MTGLLTVSIFLTTLIFSLILFVLWVQIALRYFRISILHPVSRTVYSITSPVLTPIERHVSRYTKRPSRYDWICLSFIALIEFIKFLLLGWLSYQVIIPFAYLLLFVLADLVVQPCNLLFYALLIRVILSWVNPQWSRHPAAGVLILVTDPLIRLGQRIIPNISGFDFGPFIIMIILKVITLFITASMPLALL